MQNIYEKLNLVEYIDSFLKLLSRPKPIILNGDITTNYNRILELSTIDFTPPIKILNLDDTLLRIEKKSILRLEDIFEFVKIIRYFIYIKKFISPKKELNLYKWLNKIEISDEILKIEDYFTTKGTIKEGISEEFDNIQKLIYENKTNIKKALYKVLDNSKLIPYLVDNQIHLINSQQTLLVRGGFNNIVKSSVISRSKTGFFYIIPNVVLSLKQQESNLKNMKYEILLKICKKISKIFHNNILFLKFINNEFDRLDHYQTRVFFARYDDKNFIIPTKTSKNELIDFIHPALENPKSISIDFSKSVIMLTGVNAGGKTMLLKSILSAIFLSKNLIPYKANQKSSIGYFKDIIPILDDPQNVKNDISTFAGRMVEFSKLFSKYRDNIIVGIDEIELGTDFEEAASLFKVIIDELIEKKIKVIITTHHKKLASLMANNNKVELIAAIYDEKNQKPTYDFLQGSIGRSYAFETALRYGIPSNIISKSKVLYGLQKDNLNSLIQRTTNLQLEYNNKLKILNEEINKTKTLNNKLEKENILLNEHIYKEKSKLRQEYYSATKDAKNAIKEKVYQEGHRLLNKAHKKIKSIKNDLIKQDINFKIGDMVKYQKNRCEILSIKDKKIFIQNDIGIKLEVNKSQLKLISKKVKKIKKVSLKIEKSNSGHVKLDLHGKRSDDAIVILDKFLSDALIAGFDNILVYHGRGSGKLEYAIKEFLTSYPKVVSFENANQKEGGASAKIIKL